MAAALLAAVGVVALVVALTRQVPAPPQPTEQAAGQPPPMASTDAAVADPTTGTPSAATPSAGQGRDRRPPAPEIPELGYSRPVSMSIPSIDVASSLVDIGLDADGVMETPVPVDRAGWFTPSPPPGVPGATVIAGHVTWDQQPSVFYELGALRRGDRVTVRREDGVVTVFSVTRTATFPKDEFPTKAVYSQPSRSELRLITCGGTYDDRTNRYLSNVVVWAKIVAVRRG